MKELVEFLTKSLVEFPENIKIEEVFENNETVFYIHVDERDLGKVIGKGGRIANAIRSIVKAAAVKQKQSVFVKIVSD